MVPDDTQGKATRCMALHGQIAKTGMGDPPCQIEAVEIAVGDQPFALRKGHGRFGVQGGAAGGEIKQRRGIAFGGE